MLDFIYSKVNFKARLIAVISFLVLLPLIVTSVISYRQSYEGIKNLTYGDLEYIVHIKANELSAYTESTELSDRSKSIVADIVSDIEENYYKPNGCRAMPMSLMRQARRSFIRKNKRWERIFPQTILSRIC